MNDIAFIAGKSVDHGPGIPKTDIDIYVVLNPNWNKRLAELDDNGSIAPFLDYLTTKKHLLSDELIVKKGLKSDRYYIEAVYRESKGYDAR